MNLENYNFGLYIILLCIVVRFRVQIFLAMMIACAFCIANPDACKNPSWYTRLCLLLQELHSEYLYRSSISSNEAAFSTSADCSANNNIAQRLRNENRTAIAMLTPAVHVMHHVWKGMAWITEDISEEERVTTCRTPSISMPEDSASEWDSKNDVTL
ncbi:unnamed protein product [Acanthocheilonema viteae]|uniref:Uncharacterized protein n=1 Tax=Acanthocheilonema viteae TaxID=6277 RepID=A0A498S8Y5_ACAVI|nr:unnamed protein product [Acanthocheilonema viteae]